MTMWNGKLMKENELSKPAKILVGTGMVMLFVFSAIAAIQNVTHGRVNQPSAFLLVLVGFVLFLFPKLSVMRNQKLVSFGTRLMTDNQANFYRIGYVLMLLGFLFTFA